MKKVRRWLFVGCAAAIASVLGLVFGSSASTFSGSGVAGDLSAVSALSSTNAWAVGNRYISSSDIGDFKAATEHWRGSSWSRVTTPSPAGHTAELSGVSMVSPTNVWAVGQYNATNGNDRTLIEHWRGSGWRIVRSPNPSRFGNALSGVSAVSSNNVWAVGYFGVPRTLTVHWNGSSWSRVKSPNPGAFSGSVLSAVSALSASNVWAVGFFVSDSIPKTLILHWDGTAWRKVAGRNPSGSDNELTGVSAVSPKDVWAVGYENTSSGDRTLVEHWDGTRWSRIKSPNPTGEDALAAVSAVSSTDVWAVGSTGAGSVKTLIEHWDGTRWSRVTSPNTSSTENELRGVIARSATDVWAVGYSKAGAGHRTLVEHWNGTAWSVK